MTVESAPDKRWREADSIELLREVLEVDRWLVWGASWGVTLALAYAQRFPQRVSEMVLLSITMTRRLMGSNMRTVPQFGVEAKHLRRIIGELMALLDILETL